MAINSTTILVTGGAGYIGSHICKALKQAGYIPVTYDNLSTGNEHAVKWGPFEQGDVLNKDHLVEVIKKYNIQAVIHLAAFIAVEESVADPGKYYHNNNGLNLLKAMAESAIDKIVFSSTAAVYGTPDTVPVTEKCQIKPVNPYGFSKYIMEQMLKDFAACGHVKYVTLRYFNVAGADLQSETGCRRQAPNNLIPILMSVASKKQNFVEIYGTDYDTDDGTAIRDYIHVVDLADAHILALNYLFKDGSNVTLNLGTGQGHSVKEVIDSVARVTNQEVPAKNAPRRAGDSPILFANVDKAKEVLGWKAKYTDLDIITKTAWDWQQVLNKFSATAKQSEKIKAS